MKKLSIFKLLFLTSGVISGIIYNSPQAIAQITPDNTLNSTVITEGTLQRITEGSHVGNNLFHSFSEFNISTGETAFFDNATTIENIITRVTGGNISNLDGILRTNGDANFFLINPGGIVFGDNATLEIGGSFVGSTAESFIFNDGITFSATDTETPPLLSISVPMGLQYGSNANSIQVQGTLQGGTGRTLTLAGGDIEITGGQLQVQEGRISLASSTAGTLTLDDNFGIVVNPEIPNKGNVNLSQQGLVEITGVSGGIDIITENLHVTEGSRIQTIITESGNAGDITLNATETITIDGFGEDGLFSGILSRSLGEDGGIGGDITLNSSNSLQGNLSVSNRGFIAAVTESNSNGGNIEINVNNLSLLSGGQIISLTTGDSDSGNLTLNVTDAIKIGGRNFELAVVELGELNVFDLNQLTFTTSADPDIENSETIPHVSVERTATEIRSGTTILGKAKNEVFDFFSFTITEAGSQGIFDIDNGYSEEGKIDTRIFLFDFATGELLIDNDDDTNTRDSFINTTISAPGTYVLGIGDFRTNTSAFTVLEGNSINSRQTYTLQVSLENQGTLSNSNPKLDSNLNNFNQVNNFNQGINSGLFSVSENSGNSGNIIINAESLTVQDGGTIVTRTLDSGNGGDIRLSSNSLVNINDGFVSTIARGSGDAGETNINTNSLEVRDVGRISANTFGQGRGGNISINTNSLGVLNGSFISAKTFGEGEGGVVTINAINTIQIYGEGVLTAIQSEVENSASGNAGGISINTRSLEVRDQGEISGTTFGAGNAGIVRINTETAILDGGSQEFAGIFSQTIERPGEGEEKGKGDAGGVILNTGSLEIISGGRIETNTGRRRQTAGITQVTGDAGIAEINATSSISLDGDKSTISSAVRPNATGDGGNLNITSPNLTLTNNASISASSEGTGTGGSLELIADNLTLDNNAVITAATTSSQGGNITLTLGELLLLRNGSNITATAGTGGAGGNGGNITIDTPFIVAFPIENSDITANAFAGDGGNIDITTNSLLGLQFREAGTELSDITVSSQLGVAGTVNISQPEVDTGAGVIELPVDVTDPSQQIVTGCAAAEGSSFRVVGSGGLPETPSGLLRGQTLVTDWRNFSQETIAHTSSQSFSPVPTPSSSSIIEATGWTINDQGIVELVAHQGDHNYRRALKKSQCSPFS